MRGEVGTPELPRHTSMLEEAESWRAVQAIERPLDKGVFLMRTWAGCTGSIAGVFAERDFCRLQRSAFQST